MQVQAAEFQKQIEAGKEQLQAALLEVSALRAQGSERASMVWVLGMGAWCGCGCVCGHALACEDAPTESGRT